MVLLGLQISAYLQISRFGGGWIASMDRLSMVLASKMRSSIEGCGCDEQEEGKDDEGKENSG